MARIKMVTRTIVSTRVQAMVVDTNTADVSIEEHTIVGNLSADEAKESLNIIFEHTESNFVVVKCTVLETIEELYGMTETVFLMNAKKLPPRSKAEDAE